MARLFRHPTDPPAPDAFVVRRSPVDAAALVTDEAGPWHHAEVIRWGHDDYRTSFRAMWTDEALVARFECEDTEPWWTIVERDGRLWEEEVVEIFLDPSRTGRDYAEVEVSPANTVCDLHVRTPWPDLQADLRWDWDGLHSRVFRTAGPGGRVLWTAVILLPFAGLRGIAEATGSCVPPRPDDRWRFNVFRIKRPGGPVHPEAGALYAAWSVPEGPSFHVPAVFRDLVFTA